ncbi:MAG: family 4 glycosyl hydrolase [Candidatus Helarchaeota archaeon]
MSNKEKIVLIGAGSLQFGLGTVGNILKSEALKGATISLLDIDSESLNLVTNACQSAIEKQNLDFTLESTTIRKEALKNATFIINSIEVTPRFEFFEMDYEIPCKFGSKQVMGENGGPGGLFHSLRVIPPILEICEDINKICPNALLINFSNPMSRICLAIKRKYPKLKFVGLCHEIQFAINQLPKILNTPFSNLKIKAGGLNHFGVVLTAKYRDTGKDAYPDIRKKGPEQLKTLTTLDVDLTRNILEIYGYLPYTFDSHYGEYIQWAWEKVDFKGVRNFYNTYKTYTLDTSKRIKRLIKKGKGHRLVKPDDERAIPIIEGILTDSNYEELSVNLPNDDVITNLPRDLVVECPAIINKSGLHPVKLGDYPKGLAALLRNQASVQDLVVEAVLTKSKKLALQALLADPVVDSQDQAIKTLEEMLKLQAGYIHLV